jgi:hypothetical protein
MNEPQGAALFKLLIPMSLLAMSGCVVAPYGYHRGWYGPRLAVVAPLPFLPLPLLPPPVVTVRPYVGGCKQAPGAGRSKAGG